MYIEPSTNIRLLNGVHLDPTYQHTIYFADATAQATYFISKTKHNLTDYYFQRKDRGVVKVKVPIGQLYDCNYMMYKNTEFSNKWFYAFITNVEYANNGSSYVYFQIDVMQTWFFDYEILPSFVLRDHAMTDVAGDNIVPEEVQADVQYINNVNEQRIICEGNYVLSSVEVRDDYTPDDPDDPHHYEFLPGYTHDPTSGLSMPYEVYAIGNQIATPQALLDFIKILLDGGQGEALMGIAPYYNDASVSLSRPSQIGSYVPKNKKLLTGQYCRFTFELGGNILEVPLDVVPNPTVQTQSRNSIRSIYGFNEYRVYLTNYAGAAFPTSMSLAIPISLYKWAYNDYANTVALQNEATAMMLAREDMEKDRDYVNATEQGLMGATNAGIASGMAIATGGASLLAGGAQRVIAGTSDMANSAISLAELATNIDAHAEAISRHHANMRAPQTGGSTNSNKLLADAQMYLSGYVWTVLPQDAERIDKFFDMYGYAQNVMKIPNRNGRTHWNYVKTAGLEIHSNCPQEDMKTIVKIYENGITFWNNGDEVGNYSLDNTLH